MLQWLSVKYDAAKKGGEKVNMREFTLSDTADVISLWEACGLTVPWNDPKKDIDRKMKVNPELFLVMEENNKIIGSVMGGYDGHRGWINYLAVCPKNRKKGIGKKLMFLVEEKIKEKGCPKINLQVRENNTDVIEFYNAIGYSIDKAVSFGKRLVEDA